MVQWSAFFGPWLDQERKSGPIHYSGPFDDEIFPEGLCGRGSKNSFAGCYGPEDIPDAVSSDKGVLPDVFAFSWFWAGSV